jgi:glycosyltransferase involved in cell wall biosynthesis
VHDLIHEKLPEFFSGFMNKVFLFNKSKSIKKADKLIVISQQTKKDLIDFYKINNKKIDIVYHGVSDNFRRITDDEKNKFLNNKNISRPFLLFIGNRSLYKNFLFLLETFYFWNKKHKFDLYCIGGNNFTKKEKRKIKEFGLSNSVKLFQNVSENDLIGFYNCAQAFIFPSLYEGFGLPILEGLSCGTLVLASDLPIFREIGQDSLIYFDPKNKESLLVAMDKISTNKIFNQDKINNLLEKFNWRNTISETFNVYQK